MATLAQQANFAIDAGGEPLNRRIWAAVNNAAYAVYQEAGATPNHAARLAWASRWLNSPTLDGARAWKAAMSAVSGVVDGTAITDADITTAVNGLVNLFATPYVTP